MIFRKYETPIYLGNWILFRKEIVKCGSKKLNGAAKKEERNMREEQHLHISRPFFYKYILF